jgi:hypothetical protein
MNYGLNFYILPNACHELFFDSIEDIQKAMSTAEGQAAGETLQRMTAGRVTLLLADHKEDDLENIRRHIHPDNFDE